MGDSNSVSASVTYAMPLRPDFLGQSLEAYERVLPVLAALRCCHRYGRGPQAHITKLPAELLDIVESSLFADVRQGITTWSDSFHHFEGRCEPIDHVDDFVDVLVEADTALDLDGELCSDCSAGRCFPPSCKNDCYEKVNELANEMVMEQHFDHYMEVCDRQRRAWEKLLDDGANGTFAKYSKLLYQHFGLEIYVRTTRKSSERSKTWPAEAESVFEYDTKTTTCFLTLPRQAPKTATYPLGDGEVEGGGFSVLGAISAVINIPTVESWARVAKRFHRARRLLNLKPYIHDSQLDCTFEPTGTTNRVDESTTVEAACSDKSVTAENTEWPQLVLLVSSKYELDMY